MRGGRTVRGIGSSDWRGEQCRDVIKERIPVEGWALKEKKGLLMW